MECDEYRDEIRKLKYAVENIKDFALWLVEVHHNGEESWQELWEKFEQYEDSFPDNSNQNS